MQCARHDRRMRCAMRDMRYAICDMRYAIRGGAAPDT
ncbi:hypothetical protein BPC006_II2865 [Burkholderia pseudomallei BPC006]|nr:hypothetical protein BPC006_II2865 [Burkholderia pseudomallei BPC006]